MIPRDLLAGLRTYSWDGVRRGVFFFQAEDGIRDGTVTGVQTCALPILRADLADMAAHLELRLLLVDRLCREHQEDRKSTRLNSSHSSISYAAFCLKKKKYEEC